MEDGMQKLKMRLPAIILLAATLLFWGFYDRYELAGPVLLKDPALADASRVRGDCTGTNGHFVLRVHADGKTANLNFRMPEATVHELVRVRGRIKVDGVVVGKYPWSCARLMLTQYDAKGKWIPGEHGLVAERGSKDWKQYEDVFKIMDGAAYADVVIQQGGKAGTAEFDSIVAEPVKLRKSFFWWQGIFAVLWVGMAGLYYRRCRLHVRRLRILILLNVIAILFGTLMPTAIIQTLSDGLKQSFAQSVERLAAPGPSTPKKGPAAPKNGSDHETKRIDQFNKAVDGAHSMGHFILFASLGFLVYLSAALERQHPIFYFKVALDLLVFAAITESLQYLTLDRTAGVGDWLIDSGGMLLAFVLFMIVRFLPRRGKENAV
jgi:VanZ family protein